MDGVVTGQKHVPPRPAAGRIGGSSGALCSTGMGCRLERAVATNRNSRGRIFPFLGNPPAQQKCPLRAGLRKTRWTTTPSLFLIDPALAAQKAAHIPAPDHSYPSGGIRWPHASQRSGHFGHARKKMGRDLGGRSQGPIRKDRGPRTGDAEHNLTLEWTARNVVARSVFYGPRHFSYPPVVMKL